jgi:hypothetical protein
MDKWEALKMRCQEKARKILHNNRSDGIAIVTVYVVMSYDGSPLLWVVPAANRVEPSGDAQVVMEEIVARLVGD